MQIPKLPDMQFLFADERQTLHKGAHRDSDLVYITIGIIRMAIKDYNSEYTSSINAQDITRMDELLAHGKFNLDNQKTWKWTRTEINAGSFQIQSRFQDGYEALQIAKLSRFVLEAFAAIPAQMMNGAQCYTLSPSERQDRPDRQDSSKMKAIDGAKAAGKANDDDPAKSFGTFPSSDTDSKDHEKDRQDKLRNLHLDQAVQIILQHTTLSKVAEDADKPEKVLELALRNYEIFKGMTKGTATSQDIISSPADIEGWAKWYDQEKAGKKADGGGVHEPTKSSLGEDLHADPKNSSKAAKDVKKDTSKEEGKEPGGGGVQEPIKSSFADDLHADPKDSSKAVKNVNKDTSNEAGKKPGGGGLCEPAESSFAYEEFLDADENDDMFARQRSGERREGGGNAINVIINSMGSDKNKPKQNNYLPTLSGGFNMNGMGASSIEEMSQQIKPKKSLSYEIFKNMELGADGEIISSSACKTCLGKRPSPFRNDEISLDNHQSDHQFVTCCKNLGSGLVKAAVFTFEWLGLAGKFAGGYAWSFLGSAYTTIGKRSNFENGFDAVTLLLIGATLCSNPLVPTSLAGFAPDLYWYVLTHSKCSATNGAAFVIAVSNLSARAIYIDASWYFIVGAICGGCLVYMHYGDHSVPLLSKNSWSEYSESALAILSACGRVTQPFGINPLVNSTLSDLMNQNQNSNEDVDMFDIQDQDRRCYQEELKQFHTVSKPNKRLKR